MDQTPLSRPGGLELRLLQPNPAAYTLDQLARNHSKRWNLTVAFEEYLTSGEFVDCDHPAVIEYAHQHAGEADSDLRQALNFYYAIRDGIRYDPYLPVGVKSSYRASDAVTTGVGWCVPKAALLAAC